MDSTDTDTHIDSGERARLTGDEAGCAKRAGWLLVAAFLVFVAAVALMIVLLPDYEQALEEAASAQGVTINELSAEDIAPIAHEHNPLSHRLLIFGGITAALVLFIAGIRAAVRVRSADSWVATAAVVAAALVPVAWLGIFVLEAGVAGADPGAWVDRYDAAYAPLLAASAIAGSLAVTAMVVLLRRIRVARRTGIAAIVLSALLIAVAPFLGAPPIAPLLLGAVVGMVMIRTARSVG